VPSVTFPAAESQRLLTDTRLYCLMTEAQRCEQFAQSQYAAAPRQAVEIAMQVATTQVK